MDIKTYKDYEQNVERVKGANKDDIQMALQIVNLMSAQNITSCNAKIILGLCNDIIDVNSKIIPVTRY